MDWKRLIKAIGIFLSIIGAVTGVFWLLRTHPYIFNYVAMGFVVVGFVAVIYTILGET